MVIVQHLRKQLPPGYVAEPRVHLGTPNEIGLIAFDSDDAPSRPFIVEATAAWAAAQPIVAVETEAPDEYEYEVRVYDAERGRTLVAAIEIVSPANKDRPGRRNAFVGKCAALLQKGVAVSLVDLVTVRQFNLYAELMAFIGHEELAPVKDAPAVYVASCRWVPRGRKYALETWSHPLTVGQPLPTLPLWLAENLILPLDLEPSYEQACSDLWIT
jgi:Protein of unknown function (DUF4058)